MTVATPRAVCPQHVQDTVLRQRIRTHATERRCRYCAATGPAPIAMGWAGFAG